MVGAGIGRSSKKESKKSVSKKKLNPPTSELKHQKILICRLWILMTFVSIHLSCHLWHDVPLGSLPDINYIQSLLAETLTSLPHSPPTHKSRRNRGLILKTNMKPCGQGKEEWKKKKKKTSRLSPPDRKGRWSWPLIRITPGWGALNLLLLCIKKPNGQKSWPREVGFVIAILWMRNGASDKKMYVWQS